MIDLERVNKRFQNSVIILLFSVNFFNSVQFLVKYKKFNNCTTWILKIIEQSKQLLVTKWIRLKPQFNEVCKFKYLVLHILPQLRTFLLNLHFRLLYKGSWGGERSLNLRVSDVQFVFILILADSGLRTWFKKTWRKFVLIQFLNQVWDLHFFLGIRVERIQIDQQNDISEKDFKNCLRKVKWFMEILQKF